MVKHKSISREFFSGAGKHKGEEENQIPFKTIKL